MAGFVFENMTAAQAASFKATDNLYFQSTDPSALTATFTPAAGVNVATITLTADGRSLTFPAATLETTGHVSFLTDGSTVVLNHIGGAVAVADTDSVVFGLADSSLTTPVAFNFTVAAGSSDHAIHGGAAADTVVGGTAAGDNNVWGGLGADTITLGDGNNHVYGGNNVAGEKDGADVITVGAGSNYVNGNAGADTITVGSATSTGVDRVQGGADNDHISILGDVKSSSAINGNKGDDTIDASASKGTNSLRGGQGDDTILTGHGHDTVLGDAGNDTITVGGTNADGHLTILTGGDGEDTFDFHTAQSGSAFDISATGVATAGTFGAAGAATYYQEVTDFTVGTDSLNVGTTGSSANFAALKTNFANVHDAQQAAASDSHAIVATQVGGDTYVFWAGGDEVVKLDHVTASTLDFHSFV